MNVTRVLVAEDNSATRLLLRDFLGQLEGIEVCGEAANGQEALTLIQSQAPDLITLDLIMPVMNGHAVLRALQGQPPAKRPKVLVISHVGSDQVVQHTLALGADFYLLKPVNLPEVAQSIHMLCEGPAPPEHGAVLGQILWLLEQMEVSNARIGFRCAALTAAALYRAGERNILLKEAYAAAMEEFHTNRDNVDKNLRDYIQKVHEAGSPAYRQVMGKLPDHRPTNREFLFRLTRAVHTERQR